LEHDTVPQALAPKPTIENAAPPLDARSTDLLIARLGARHRPGAAFFAARAARTISPSAAHWDPSLWRALAITRFVTSANGELVHDLRAAIEQHLTVDASLDQEMQSATELVRLAAAIRPALLAPQTNAAALLDPISDDLRPLAEFVRVLRENGSHGFELTPALLSGAQTNQRWQQDLVRHRQAVARWWQDRRRATMKFQATTRVWRTWLNDTGLIGRLLTIVVEDQRANAEELRSELGRLTDDVIRQEMLRTDQEHRVNKNPIVGDAAKQLLRVTREGLELCESWLPLIRPLENRPDYLQQAADGVRRDFLAHLPAAREHLGRLAGGESVVSLCAQITLAGVEEMGTLLSSGTFPTATLPPALALAIDLLPAGHLALRANGEPVEESRGLLMALAEVSPTSFRWDDPETWAKAFNEREARRDTLACDMIANNVIPSVFGDSALGDATATRLRRLVDECSLELERKRSAVSVHIQRAAIARMISESDAKEFDLIVVAAGTEPALDSRGAQHQLVQVEKQLGELTAERITELRQEAEPLARSQPESYQRIIALLDAGDVATAHEYVEIARKGHALPDRRWVEPDPLLSSFWPTFVDAFLRDGSSLADCQRHMEQGAAHGVFITQGISPELLRDAAALLARWNTLKRMVANGDVINAARHLRELLLLVGIEAREKGVDPITLVPGDARRKFQVFDAQMRPISSKSACLVSSFGSQAQGRYRVIVSWDATRTPDALLELARETQRRDAPSILISLQPLKPADREQLSRRSRDRNGRRTLLVLDDVLLAFLATQPVSERLAAFTRCGFPFTWVDPYSATAGMVPVEMFFGRARESGQIVDPNGSCLVYGGRQLGKTALLKHVESTVNDPAHGIIAKYVDLKAEQIGTTRPTTQVWNVISTALQEFGVCTPNVGAETFKERARAWLDQVSGRRVLLLLDEADVFFQKDGSGEGTTSRAFPDVWTLKAFMEQTDRRFKVVFAGLHNVQRMARDPNSPLAHLGQPICIGPLFGEDQEWNDARDLVTEPMRAAGFCFESPDAVMRILAHCNYYPSLIQLFCKELLEHLNRRLLESSVRPPFKVRVVDVDEAYTKSGLRRAILDRFQWTLDLDLRYKLIALLIAFESGAARETLRLGFSIDEIRRSALGWWAKGFSDDPTFEHFRVLLEEMVGLGILRNVGENRFTLRNPNVLGLLGTDEEIERQLDDVVMAEPPVEYEPSTFRRDLRTEDGRRSALTAKQEALCFERKSGVVLLFGHELSGLKDVRRSLMQVERTGDVKFHVVESRSRDDLRKRLEGQEQAVLVVPHEIPWDATWVQVAVNATRNRRQRWLRVILVGQPEHAWSWCTSVDVQATAGEHVVELGLAAWTDATLRKWLDDHQLVPTRDPDSRREILALTGGLSELLYSIPRGSPRWREALKANADRVMVSAAAMLGLESRRLEVLKNLVALGRATVEDLAAISELADEKVARVLKWAELLGYLRIEDGGARSVVPIVARSLEA
jgi:hypothetical protein